MSKPVAGTVLRIYEPVGRYGGHWGVDFAAEAGSAVLAADGGEVTFAGSVAGVLSVTVHHGGGLRTSYSYLSEVLVAAGQMVSRSDLLGRSGVDHGAEAVHFSVRIGDEYRDPEPWLRCWRSPALGLSLVPASSAYPAPRATRNPRRYIRSPSPGSPVRRRGCLSRPGSRHCDVLARRCPVAEGGPPGDQCRRPLGDDRARR
ncbi:MAG: M23 family metallopeptidase [bacterium]|nr:M23 family metallopeptidase [bacterium]